MKLLIAIITIILLTLLLYWKIILTTDEIIEYLPLKSPKSYKVLRDTTSGNGEWRTVKIVVDKEYYNKTKKMIMGHEKFRNLGYNQDSLRSYKKNYLKNGWRPSVYSFKGSYFYEEFSGSNQRLEGNFLLFFIELKKDSMITIVCQPNW
ncbi:MAG: hypothetical protein CVV25_07830 [Ignavibacteriae bacterium HGW-Ignavibacteriae-4]|jgi:hypothetical protein|nr:MAG: hypothetical protein CVV25_07830 [Ignavibacteriae bacterium HGW-Ignavibacteriae-4]